MPSQRLKWHFTKCIEKKTREKLGLPIYHCQFNYSHIFFEKKEIDFHEKYCKENPKKINFEDLSECAIN
jgi:hypothetical protein